MSAVPVGLQCELQRERKWLIVMPRLSGDRLFPLTSRFDVLAVSDDKEPNILN